jgi:cell division protein ZapA
MPQISVTINGRAYPVACAEGEEARIQHLAQDIDHRVASFAKQVGQAGEGRLLVLAALVLADELAEARATLANGGGVAAREYDAGEIAAGMDELAARIEAVAARLETSHI